MLSTDAFAQTKGEQLRRYVIAAGVLRGVFTLDDLADAIGVTPAAMRSWWGGVRPKAETIGWIARVTGFSRNELYEWLHFDGPPPSFSELMERAVLGVDEGTRRGPKSPVAQDETVPAESPEQPPPETGPKS